MHQDSSVALLGVPDWVVESKLREDESNYASMAKRIRSCQSAEDFSKVNQSLERLYNAGVFTASELGRLDSLAVDCQIQLGL